MSSELALFSSASAPEVAPVSLQSATVDEPEPGIVGDLFRAVGYKWLGPGTDIEYNVANGIEPTNELDRVARTHDLAYNDIKFHFEQGDVTYEEAAAAIRAADEDFVQGVANEESWEGALYGTGMTMKYFTDHFFGPSWAGIKKENYGIKRPYQGGGPSDDPKDVWHQYIMSHYGQDGWKLVNKEGFRYGDVWEYNPPPDQNGGWEWDANKGYWFWHRPPPIPVDSSPYDYENLHRGEPGWVLTGRNGWQFTPSPGSDYNWDGEFWIRRASAPGGYFDLDRDRNYIPDQLQSRKRRRRHRRYRL